MLIEELIEDGKYVQHYSDSDLMIRQTDTDILYTIAIDIRPCIFTYVETNISNPPILEERSEDETDDEYLMRLSEYNTKYLEWVNEMETKEAERIKAEEEARKKAEEEARKKAEEEARLQKEAEEAQELQTVKDGRIAISKLNLATWLENHPYTFTKADGTSDIYSVTAEKQQLLALEIMTDQMKLSNNIECTPSWNAQGKVCEAWDFNELNRLAIEISNYVKPKISIQQHTEADIQACEDKDSVMAIPVGVDIYD